MKLPPFDIFPKLKNNKVLLREIRNVDLNDIVEISYYNGVKADSILQASEMLGKIETDFTNGNSIHWGIADINTGRLVGTCGYYRGFKRSSGELGCILLSQFRGMGFMTPALQLAIESGKNEMNLNRIWAATTKDNVKAIKLLDRLGFVFIKELIDNEAEYEFTAKPLY